jgi:glucose-1-phosphate thymidylyltransferase
VIDSLVGPYVSLAKGNQVRTSIVKDSIINEESHIEEAMLAWSLVGRDARVRGAFERLNVGDSSEIDSSQRLVQEPRNHGEPGAT